MTVYQLINKLSEYNPNLEVYLSYENCYGDTLKIIFKELDVIDNKEKLYLSDSEERPE